MTSRVEVDANIVLWLEVSQYRSDGDRVRSGLIQVVDSDVQVEHLLLLPGSFRPYRGLIVRLGLERQTHPPLGATEEHPVGLAGYHVPTQEPSIEIREDVSVRAIQDHRCERQPGGPIHGFTVLDLLQEGWTARVANP